jgi:hypothetical protein
MTPDFMERPTVDILLSHPRLSKMMLRRRRSQYVSQVVGYQRFYIFLILTEPTAALGVHCSSIYVKI